MEENMHGLGVVKITCCLEVLLKRKCVVVDSC